MKLFSVFIVFTVGFCKYPMINNIFFNVIIYLVFFADGMSVKIGEKNEKTVDSIDYKSIDRLCDLFLNLGINIISYKNSGEKFSI
jgi:hypothetical protein